MATKPETLNFEPGSYTLDYIKRNLVLPQVIRCDHAHHGSLGGGGGVGCDTALLLHHPRDIIRATGVLLTEDGPDKNLKEIGEHVVIPFDYDGWFTVFTSKPKAKHVPLYHNMPALLEADCDVFLIGGKRKLKVKLQEGGGLKTAFEKPGTALKIHRVTTNKPYVQCSNGSGKTLFVGIDSRGVFYMISKKNKKPMKVKVMQMEHILSDPKVKMPCLVKLIQGPKPFKHDPTDVGWIKLTGIDKSSTFIAATASIKENGLVELTTQSPVKYKLATMNGCWKEFRGYKDAMRLCDENAEIYGRSIKSARSEVSYESNFPEEAKRRLPDSSGSIRYVPSIPETTSCPRRNYGCQAQEPKTRPISQTYLTPIEVPIHVNKRCNVAASTASQNRPPNAEAAPDYVNVSKYDNVIIISDDDSLSSFSDEWGDDDHDYVNVDDMSFGDSDGGSKESSYTEIWPLIQKREKQGQGQRSSVCDSGVFSIAGSDVGQEVPR